MRVRYQQGYLRLGRRKHGPDCWEFLCVTMVVHFLMSSLIGVLTASL